jgi:hypothetical protein
MRESNTGTIVSHTLTPWHSRTALGLLIYAAIIITGCSQGPTVGTVKGTITMDGQPLDGNALIRMVPKDSQSQPADCIVKGGAYSITMPVGEKKVEIYWTKTDGPGKLDTASQGSEKVVVLVPAKYNTETTLTYTVEKGTHTKDFDLTK